MKFIVDAQLPIKLSEFLKTQGFDSIHTLDLQLQNATPDEQIRDICSIEDRILITKDSDFEDSFLLRNIPKKLIFLSTGNIKNSDLIKLFEINLPKILDLLSANSFIEVNQKQITVRI
jgi:predicted nuclease of predicted toxin-antitoxin system